MGPTPPIKIINNLVPISALLHILNNEVRIFIMQTLEKWKAKMKVNKSYAVDTV